MTDRLADIPVRRERIACEVLLESMPLLEDLLIFMRELTCSLGMRMIGEPFVVSSDSPGHGHGYHIHVNWIESGADIYTWPEYRFLTLDVYTCGHLEPEIVTGMVRRHWLVRELQWMQPHMAGADG